MSSSSKVQDELHEKSKRREFLYSYFNRPDGSYGRSRISFEKSVRASDREMLVARRTVKSGTTRTSGTVWNTKCKQSHQAQNEGF